MARDNDEDGNDLDEQPLEEGGCGNSEHEARDYEVGYGKPPRHTRFPPGQSGNPRGRKKGSRGLKTDLAAELNSKITIKVHGKKVSGTTQRMMLRTLALRAGSGDLKASAQLIPLILQVLGIEDRGTDARKLAPDDQAILDAFLAEMSDGGPAIAAASEGPRTAAVAIDGPSDALPAPPGRKGEWDQASGTSKKGKQARRRTPDNSYREDSDV